MANLSEDVNHTTIQAVFCTNASYGIQLHVFIIVLNILLAVIAFTSNVLILIALHKCLVRPPTKLLFRCLSSTDLCVGLILQPLYVTYLIHSQSPNICHLLGILTSIAGGIFCGVSLTTLTAISVDRLLALLLVMKFKEVVTLGRVRFLVAIFWAFCGTSTVLFVVSFYVAVGLVSIIMVLCLMTSAFCYTKIYISFNKHQKQLRRNIPLGNSNKPEGATLLNTPQYKKTVSFSLWLQMALMMCFLPFAIVAALYAFIGLRSPLLDFAWHVALSIVMFNSSLNPILYFWKIKGVREAVKDTMKKLTCCHSP